jgi:hypothetical protein
MTVHWRWTDEAYWRLIAWLATDQTPPQYASRSSSGKKKAA